MKGKSKGLSSHEQKVKLPKDRGQQLPLLKKIKAAPSLNKPVSLAPLLCNKCKVKL
jgi:hypothetical protein